MKREPPPLTHYCLYDMPGGRLVRALCGLLIYRREHSNEPTCPECLAELCERNAEAIEGAPV
jgi:hypothetical protein